MKSRRIDFEKLNNTRDLGGMRGAQGMRIRTGKLIRSGHLYAGSDADRTWLSRNVGLIVDFRTERERAEKPDPDIPGTAYRHMPVFDELTAGITREKRADAALEALIFDPEGARQYMIDTYLGFATSQTAHAVYGRFLRLLSEERNGAVLWHCTAGKDRAGFASMLIEKILGVDDADIMEDYLYTNDCLAGEVALLTGMIEKHVGRSDPKLRQAVGFLFGADEAYMTALFDRIGALYGDFNGYLRDALGVDDGLVEKLRGLYLE